MRRPGTHAAAAAFGLVLVGAGCVLGADLDGFTGSGADPSDATVEGPIQSDAEASAGDSSSDAGLEASVRFMSAGYADPPGEQSSVAVSLLQTAGSLSVVMLAWFDKVTPRVASLVDTAGNPYVPALTSCGQQVCQSMYYASKIRVPSAGAPNVVTATMTAPALFLDLRVVEYTGLTSYIDSAFNSGFSVDPAGIINARADAKLVIIGGATQGRLLGARGFTLRVTTMPDFNIAGDVPVTAPGAIPIAADLETRDAGVPKGWILQWAAFR